MRFGFMEQNGHYGLDILGTNASSSSNPSHHHNSSAAVRMNGEIPSVPITTLAGIASLTDLLPELPVPGPSPHGHPNPGSALLYHRAIVQEASHLLSSPTELLAAQLANLLANTSVDYIELADRHQVLQQQQQHSQQLPQNNLANMVYRINPAAFFKVRGTGGTGNNQWNNDDGSHHYNNFSEGYANSTADFAAQQQYVSSGGDPSFHQNFEEKLPFDAAAAAEALVAAAAAHEGSNHLKEEELKPDVDQAKVVFKPMIKLNKLSKEAEQMMQRSLTAYNKQNADKIKNEEMGVYDNFTPRSRKAKNKPSYGSGGAEEDSEGESGDSEDDNDNNKKSRNKFFKATEKERDDEKKKVKEERKKRKLDQDFQPPDEAEENFGKRRRKEKEESAGPGTPEPFVPKKVTRKIERKLVPMIPKIDAEELMEESSTFSRFNKTVELIFDNMEEINLQDFEQSADETEIPPEILIPKYQLADLAAETAKLKSLGVMESISAERLVKLLNILELNIRDGSRVIPLPVDGDDDEDDEEGCGDKLWLELAMERVMRAADASLTVVNILTSRNMSKRVYIDDVIDRVALFLRFQLSNTIYPSYDPVYKEISKSKTGYVGSMKKKRTYSHAVRDKNILALYNKTHELTSMMADLVKMQLLTDTTILHISTLGVAPFFVESIPELQLAALKLVTNLFSKYEKHRKLLLDDILASIARLPSSKRSLRSYRLNSTTHIQMLTALVLQLIQCVVILPNKLCAKDAAGAKKQQKEKEAASKDDNGEAVDEVVDREVLINNKYSMAMGTAHQFLTVFLKKCGAKNEDVDYRPLFENFVQDLLTTVNTPEWPAAELLLSLLGRVLREKFKDRSTEMPLRISSLEYLGVVAARLRKDAVQSKTKLEYIDSIIKIIREEEEKEKSEEDGENGGTPSKKKKNKAVVEDAEEERNKFLQRVLLDYLAVNGGEDDQAAMNARHFYICQWYRDVNAMGRKPKAAKKKKHNNHKKHSKNDTSSEEDDEEEEEEEEADMSDSKKTELYRLKEVLKDQLVAKIPPFGVSKGNKAQVLSTHIDHDSAHLIVKYLSSKRPFFNSFNFYLADILKVLTEQSTQIRTKALKCMTMIVTEDPEVLLREDMRRGVHFSFLDSSTMVREAAVDLVGKFILHKQDLITQYYTIITERILDTGVSVRKRVIKILKDICTEFPGYDKIPEICVKMIRRINDEEGIRKLVMDVFQNLWFVPLRERNRSNEEQLLLVTRARNITDVVVACRDTGLEWFEQLLQTLFKPREDKEDATKKATEPPPQLVLACQQIVDCLVESVLRIEEDSIKSLNKDGRQQQQAKSMGSNNRIVACLTTLYLFAKIRPQLLVEHVQTLQPYLQIQCQTQGDYQIISNVARTLELSVPLIKHPSEIFLSQLEEDSVKLILQHDKKVISACLSCLGSIVNSVTKNFGLIRDCFQKYYGQMIKYRSVHEANPDDPRLLEKGNMAMFRRAMFTVSLLLRHFDFGCEDVYLGLPSGADTVEEVFETVFYFMRHDGRDIQSDTLHALGFVCIRHHKFMLESKLRQLYIDILTEDFYSVQHKIKVLNNLESYLSEEEVRMRKLDEHWKEYANKENLKEMGDVSSGMASTVIQVYLKAVLDSFIHPDVLARHAALKVISLILAQGLVHPVQIVPYLICMSTDSQTVVSHTADRELQEIEKKYPGFIHMKLLQGIKLSHRLQEICQGGRLVRGCRVTKDGEIPTALNGFLYSIMKTTKAQRRAILTNLLKQFDDTAKSPLTLMLYLADNLAYIPFTVVDEPLFVIHQIDIMISVAGSNLLQTYKESLRPPPSAEQRFNLETGKTDYLYDEDLDDEYDSVRSRLPEDCTPLREAITASQGCLLLLVLKEHLKDFYGLTAAKIQQYSPTDTSKAYDRQVNRRTNVRFNPKATVEILKKGAPPGLISAAEKEELVKKYLEFKELMNKIDPDEEEEDEDNPNGKTHMPGLGSGGGGGNSNHATPTKASRHHNNHAFKTPKPLMPQLTRRKEQQQPQHAEPDYGNMSGMVLDPETGMMVPGGGGGGGGGEDDEDDICIIGQASAMRDTNAQGTNRSIPKIKINLGGGKSGSNKSSSHHHHHNQSRGSGGGHHQSGGEMKKHHKKKKKKKYASDDSGSDSGDPDFRA